MMKKTGLSTEMACIKKVVMKFAVACLLLTLASGVSAINAPAGSEAPDFTLTSLSGQPVSLGNGSYGIRVYPSTVIIDREGKIAYDIPGHALDYKTRVEGTLRYMTGEIGEEQLKTILNPVLEIRDEAALAAERRYNLALRLTEARLVDHAIQVAQQSLIASPDLLKSHILLGYLFLHRDELDNALSAFRKALEIDADSSDARTGLGAALVEEGEAEQAIAVLPAVSAANPNPHMTRYELGRAYELRGKKGDP